MTELEVEDPAALKSFVQVEPAMFQELLNRLEPAITMKDTFYRMALHSRLRWAITLRFLATRDSYHSLMYGFRVSYNTISCIVREVCSAIIEEYQERSDCLSYHTPRMVCNNRCLQSKMVVSSCPGSHGW